MMRASRASGRASRARPATAPGGTGCCGVHRGSDAVAGLPQMQRLALGGAHQADDGGLGNVKPLGGFPVCQQRGVGPHTFLASTVRDLTLPTLAPGRSWCLVTTHAPQKLSAPDFSCDTCLNNACLSAA